MSNKSVFIVWSSQSQRAETMAAELDGQVSFQYEVRLKGHWLKPLRYLVQGWKTWRLLEGEQPGVVLVQAPPIFAPLIVAAWCELRGKTGPSMRRVPYAIDCHTSTFHHRVWRWALPLQRLLSRRAVVSLVTDQAALSTLKSWKANGFLLENPLPALSPAKGTIGSEGEERVAVVSTFDDDEPIAEVFGAARILPQVTFYLTGDPKRAATRLLAQKPVNVILTGFLRGGFYTGLLENVHGIIVLTNAPHAVNCGAYEALTVAKPTIVSDWPELRRCFTPGFIFVKNTPESIAAGVKKMLDEQTVLVTKVIALRSELANRRQPKFEELVALLKSTDNSYPATAPMARMEIEKEKTVKEA